MDEKNERKEDIDNLEVEALKDADLEDVAGGGDSNGSSSCCTYNIKTADTAGIE